MKKIILLLLIFITITCKSQSVYPLDTYPGDVPPNSYIKDIYNELNPYIGIWKADYNGKRITLDITKEIHKTFKRPDFVTTFYNDALIIKYSVDEIVMSGLALHFADNFSSTDDTSQNFIASFSKSQYGLKLFYTGTNCGVGYGEIILKLQSSNQFNWSFHPESTIITTENCPPGSDLAVHLPVTDNLIFTKQ